jgi:hypothetical protein
VNHSIKVISFDKSYNLKNFDSGEPTLNRYLTDYASQDLKRYLASVFLGIDKIVLEKLLAIIRYRLVV